MATVTPGRSQRNLQQDRTRIRSPLARLRKYIAGYVSIEGVALMLLFVALCFWVGVSIDYGFFKAFTVDWVQELPWWVRAGVLGTLTVALVTLVVGFVVLRLVRQFSDQSMALVLERRFPKVLGDRLITAVELNDPQQAAAYGYSPDMVRETIHDAADAVEKVPVKLVFDWGRLYRLAFLFVAISVGLYLLAGAAFCGIRAIKDDGPASAGYSDMNDVAEIWFERNIMLRNKIWPRKSYLEVIPWTIRDRDGEEIVTSEPSIAKGAAPQPLRVRAWKYVIADDTAPEGWRLLTWKDLAELDLGIGEVPDPLLAWKPRDPDVGLTVDEVELRLEQLPIKRGASDDKSVYLIADGEDYRPLKWSDLKRDRLGGVDVPALPGQWDTRFLAAVHAGTLGLVRSNLLGSPAGSLASVKVRTMTVEEVEKKLPAATKEFNARKTKLLADHKSQKRPLSKVELKAIAEEEAMISQARAVLARVKELLNLHEAMERITAKASDRANRRTLRKLIIPQKVELLFKSKSSSNTNTMTPVAGNEFTGNFGPLQDTVTYRVHGEDYYTEARTITVVERPQLQKLESEEDRPAYLYYRLSDGSTPDEQYEGTLKTLRGKHQKCAPVPLSVTGETTTLEVMAGSSVRLLGSMTKPLLRAWAERDAKDKTPVPLPKVKLVDGGEGFVCTIEEVRREQRFTLKFLDEDKVEGQRLVVVIPKLDTSPRIREFAPDEIIRRGKDGYMVTANARIPFKGRINDDQGLGRVRYHVTVQAGDFLSEQRVRSLFAAAAVPMLAPGTGQQFAGAAYLIRLLGEVNKQTPEDKAEEQYLQLPAYLGAMRFNQQKDDKDADEKQRTEFLPWKTVKGWLDAPRQPSFRRLLSDFVLTPDRWMDNDENPNEPLRWVRAEDTKARRYCDLPLWDLRYRGQKLKSSSPEQAQRRYIIEVRLEVEDTFTEGDMIPTALADPKLKGEKDELKAKIEEVRPFIADAVAKLPKKKDASGRALDAILKVIGESTGAIDLDTMGRGLVTAEADKQLPLVAKALSKDKKASAALGRIVALIKERQPVPHKTPSGETFTFVVVPESELLARIADEEDAKLTDIVKVIGPLDKNLESVQDMTATLAGSKLTDQDLAGMIARCNTILGDDKDEGILKAGYQDVRAVYQTYDRILREMRANQINRDLLQRKFFDVYQPLKKVTEGRYPQVRENFQDLRAALTRKNTPIATRIALARKAGGPAKKSLNDLVKDLKAIERKMQGIAKLNKIIKALELMIDKQTAQETLMKILYDDLFDKEVRGKGPK